jgi:hypothetical protein
MAMLPVEVLLRATPSIYADFMNARVLRMEEGVPVSVK